MQNKTKTYWQKNNKKKMMKQIYANISEIYLWNDMDQTMIFQYNIE